MAVVRVQADDFDAGAELAALQAAAPSAGAIASFIGVVRSDPARPLASLVLEHYEAMTHAALRRIVDEALQRFELQGCTVIHRYGELRPGDNIVFVASASAHRRAALQGTEFLIDWLKTKAPFWKRENYVDGAGHWVAAKDADDAAAARWGEK